MRVKFKARSLWGRVCETNISIKRHLIKSQPVEACKTVIYKVWGVEFGLSYSGGEDDLNLRGILKKYTWAVWVTELAHK